MRIDQSHFALFGLPEQFDLDGPALEAAYRKVQREVHPDRFVSAGDAEKRVALQWSARANEAYETLRSPLSRATYLCKLRGVDPSDETNTVMPHSFLVQQIEWHEALDDVRHAHSDAARAALRVLQADVAVAYAQGVAELTSDLVSGVDEAAAARAAACVRRLMFLERFERELAEASVCANSTVRIS